MLLAPQSHIPNAQVSAGRVADIRSRQKREKYRAMAMEQGALVIPYAVESYGALSKSAAELIKRIINAFESQPNPHLSRAAFTALTNQRLSIALQKGNALVDAQGTRFAATASLRLRAAPVPAPA